MRLKTLRLVGFKSFADRTEFHLQDGITCIVGPNGCGKSNVVDALKWVLGEQRPGALRGSEMADVIFGGTSARKPLGMAEVTLVIDNSSHKLPVDWTEVEVTRRLYRDGTSEYLLNRSQCRLRDLRELLMDTGSGPGAMAFMEQGRIDQILRESVDDRRAVFEEAAGIAKYKARRKEALRKLEKVEADLLRVTDVVAEKERLVRSLKIQAGRAERYQALVDEMKGKRLVLALHRYGTLLEERSAAATKVVELSSAEETARTQVKEAFAACRSGEEELESRRTIISRKEQDVASLQGQADTAREKSAFAARLAAELDGKIRWYVGEIESSVARLKEIASSREEIEAARATAESERAQRQQALAAAEKAIETARGAAHERRAFAAKLAERVYENLSRLSRLGNSKSRLEAEIRGLTDRLARLKQRLGALDNDVEEAKRRLATAERDGEAAAKAQQAAAAAVQSGEERTQAAERRVREVRESVSSLDREVSGTRSRVDVVRSFVNRMEGVGEGPKRFLEAAKKGDGLFPKVRGMLADLIEADAASASAVETALGACATAIVVETLEDAERAVAAVRERKLPRCVFLPIDSMTPAGGIPAEGLHRSVRCADDLRGVVAALLSDVVTVGDLAEARAVRASGGASGVRAVLADGTVVEASGAIASGGAAGGAGILQRRTELRDLTAKLEEAVSKLDAARTELSSTETSLVELRRETAAARDALRAAESAVQRLRVDADRARNDERRLSGERGHLEREASEVEVESSRAAAEAAKVAEESARVTAEQADLERSRGDAAKLQEQADVELRRAEDARSDARVGVASVSERCASLAARAEAMLREVADLESGVEEARSELAECEKRKADAEERGREASKAFETASKRREECLHELVFLRHEASQAHTALDQRRTLLESFESAASKVGHELHRYRMQENEARLRVENLLERIRDELGEDLHLAWEKRQSGTDAAPAQDGASQPVYAERAQPTLADLEQLETEVVELRTKIDKMGAVNLEALSQLEAADHEATTLRTQHDDLTKSRATLLDAVKRIDQESRALFEATFNVVRANFQEMFRKLFGGGKADVFLTEGQDILEAGIEVIARPPGKEQRAISLLSGGERTMTAVALLFAIYLAKPSPFCLMDEVDAALDETNIDRFVGVLTEFAQQSQFVIVSHNKRTIAAAGTIFGVSMPEPGVSKKLAVRLDDVADDGTIRETAAAAG